MDPPGSWKYQEVKNMPYYNICPNEDQAKQTYHCLQNNMGNGKFDDELERMAKNVVYWLMYAGVPKEVIPLIIAKAGNYSVDEVKRQIYKHKKTHNPCIICGNDKNLTIHHIKPISQHPYLQYRKNNLKTICLNCHKILHDNE